MTFRIQNRYQDEGWEWTNDQFATEEEAVNFAVECACDAICYGMVRVIGSDGFEVVCYGAGEGHNIKAGKRPRHAVARPTNFYDRDGRYPPEPRVTGDQVDAALYAGLGASILVSAGEWPPAWLGWKPKHLYWTPDTELLGQPDYRWPDRYIEATLGMCRSYVRPGFISNGWSVTEVVQDISIPEFIVYWCRIEPPFNGEGIKPESSFERRKADVELQQKYAHEKQTCIGYQNLFYDACNVIDARLGGTTTTETFPARLREAMNR